MYYMKNIFNLIVRFLFMLLENVTSINKRHNSLLNSPIGKVVVTDQQLVMSQSYNKNNRPMFSSLEINAFETDDIFNQGK